MYIKKIFTASTLILLLLTSCGKAPESTEILSTETESSSIPETESETETETETETEPETASETVSDSETSSEQTESETQPAYPECKSAAFYCLEEDNLLYSSNLDAHIAPASLTKLLTASVALYYIHSDEVFTVGSEISMVQPDSSVSFISSGQKLKLYDLITGMLLVSGNDAAYTVAVSTARALNPSEQFSDTQAVEYFCGQMNAFAEIIGMKDSHFTTPDGWDDENQYTTAKDLLTLTKYVLTVPELKEIIGTEQKYVVFASGENITWTNSNKLLNQSSPYYCKEAVGVKTGTTLNAGNCLIAAFEKNEKTYLSIAAGCNSDNDRYELTRKLFF
ncbi:MAG: D-alanyl-D-alanine carboxypeptidase, partial [Oscillospiraceae bacterium]|nr:D-alanyl-D-alanine carboxypeptidase [Oscillospiraceae bacterium]